MARARKSDKATSSSNSKAFSILDDVAIRQQEVATDHHGGTRQDAELGEQRPDPARPADLDGPALRAKMDAHGAKGRTLAREFWRLKVTPSS